ncbi:MAG: N-acetylneuraminate synthase [Candidatus Riflebacteria bacterium HGW-Riflebacteria-2]|jgi:N-acetylneuraminate synthase/N,N'-diacetyllegionaminate synthase|nr:MAG: N-acetylneuraminate synthase [Candidatus Riflebacteria bacterium HGW-Riflebacteria-2]
MFLEQFTHKPVIIAEAGVNHNGSCELAYRLIDAAARAGADAIKFQTFTAEECAGRFAATAAYQKNCAAEDQFQLLKALELPFSEFYGLKKYAEKLGLLFLSTPDGTASLELLCSLDVAVIKTGSGEVSNLPFLREIAARQRPVILSTGMSSLGEVQKAYTALRAGGADDIMLLHCTSEYPAAPADCNLRCIPLLRQAFAVPVGFSDHSEGHEAAVAATAIGAEIIEKHLTLDRSMTGPDHAASLDPQQFAELVTAVRKTSVMLGDGHKSAASGEQANLLLVRRSLVAAVDVKAGEILTADKVAIKRPAGGIAPELLHQAINRRVCQGLSADEPVTWQHLGEVVQVAS